MGGLTVLLSWTMSSEAAESKYQGPCSGLDCREGGTCVHQRVLTSGREMGDWVVGVGEGGWCWLRQPVFALKGEWYTHILWAMNGLTPAAAAEPG